MKELQVTYVDYIGVGAVILITIITYRISGGWVYEKTYES